MKDPVLEVENLRMEFRAPHSAAGKRVQAVRDVSLAVGEGEILGLVGETGSGKTTVGKCVVRLLRPTAGSIKFLGRDITAMPSATLRPIRSQIQMVFQDPYSSLDPRMTVQQIVQEPLSAHGRSARHDARALVSRTVERVGLSSHVLDRYPNELSGGQRQRVGLARALVLEPRLLIADEPVSALDVSVRAGILNLLVELQRTMGFSCLFITHDLSVAEFLCDRVAVMYLGEIVEVGTRDEVFGDARHPYTRSLLGAAPLPDPVLQRTRDRVIMPGEPPSAIDPPPGCSLNPRCPLADERCSREAPKSTSVSPSGHLARCHRVEEQLDLEVSRA
ncbi:MAG: ABC transporter ATP-binding protein [Candidatus Dormibacteraeota bacterium]|nr:ABC transporter ATP-binding protein [Candidatus Dormibacteraeota bacterium]